MNTRARFLIASILFTVMSSGQGVLGNAGVPAFPGADGYGRLATGGRGGQVLVVVNLNDRGRGSLREAIDREGPRIIVFRVSGTIVLESALRIRNGDLTLAGQSAPGDGICLRDYPVSVDANNVVIRFMRFRLGDESVQEGDALGGRFRKNIIIDHCSASWCVDECVSFYANEDFTLQWCLVAESLNDSVHAKGRHGYGGIWGGLRASFHHNLLAHHNSRNPRFSGSSTTADVPNRRLDFYNNVIYNWAGNSVYGGEAGEQNMINNYYKPGPATSGSKRSRIVNPSEPYGKFYVNGNEVAGDELVSRDNWAGGVQCADPLSVYAAEPFPTETEMTQSASTAYDRVLAYAGACRHRDGVDGRIAGEVAAGTATYRGSRTSIPGIIDSQADVGGWPQLVSLPAPPDSDGDGMPDDWELANGLDPNQAADAVAGTLDTDYDNIEVYLNGLVADIVAGQTAGSSLRRR